MSEMTILVSDRIGLLLAEQFDRANDRATELYPYEIGPIPIGDSYYDEGDGD